MQEDNNNQSTSSVVPSTDLYSALHPDRPINLEEVSPVTSEASPLDNIDELFPIRPVESVQRPSQIEPTQIPVKQPWLPVGIYVIAGFNTLAVVLSFLNSSNTKLILSVLTIIDLAVTIGLLFKRDMARKALVYLSGLTAVVSVALMVLFYVQSSNVHGTFTKNFAEIKSSSAQSLGADAKLALANSQASVVKSMDSFNRSSGLFYTFAGLIAIEATASVIYLNKAGIKRAFTPKPVPLPIETPYSSSLEV